MLHFAAKYGLEKLSCQLIESSGGEQACQIRNSSHLTPAEMAEKANHLRLANALKGHMVIGIIFFLNSFIVSLDCFQAFNELIY